MTGIIDHVERAIFDGGVVRPGETSRSATARDAIRATLEYARDNVSEAMDDAGIEVQRNRLYDDPEADPDVIFRAMITALLAELDGTESEGR